MLREVKPFLQKEWPNLKAAAAVLFASPVTAVWLGRADGEICRKPEHMWPHCLGIWGCAVRAGKARSPVIALGLGSAGSRFCL